MDKTCRFQFVIFTLFIFIFCLLGNAEPANLKIHFISVGYGDAIFIEFPNGKNMLIDAGDATQSRQLLAYLDLLKIYKIDTAIITSPQKEHFEGFLAIVPKIRIEQAFINGDHTSEEGYDKLQKLFFKFQIPVHICQRGSLIDAWPDDTGFEILNPAHLDATTNGNSIVSWLRYKDVAVLLMADAELKQQKEIFDLYPKIKEIKIIQVPHHGGPMIDELNSLPEDTVYIISTGKNNWGIPWNEDLEKIKGPIFRTDKMGHILVETDGKKIFVTPQGTVSEKPAEKKNDKNDTKKKSEENLIGSYYR